jgi:hypothetical protein
VLFKFKKKAKAETLRKEVAHYRALSLLLFYIKLIFGDPIVSNTSDQ